MKRCAKCGAELNDNVNFCSSCGGDTFIVRGNGSVQKKGNSKGILIGVVICVLLGIIGVLASGGGGDGDKTVASSSYGEIALDSQLQYKLNTFLSTFSERKIDSFVGMPDEEFAVRFALSYNFSNNNEYFEKLRPDVNLGGNYYNLRVNESVVEQTILGNFDMSELPEGFGKSQKNYSDGYYYYVFTGATVYDDSTIVTQVKQTAKDTYEVYFRLYKAFGENERLHSKSDAEVQEEMKVNTNLKYVESGKAVIRCESITDYSTYRLAEYYLY